MSKRHHVAVVGSGPAGLMAAFVAASAGHSVTLFEKRKSIGRKLLVAGSSGLNITYSAALTDFVAHYRNPSPALIHSIKNFTPSQWIEWIERLGIKTFEGTSRRYFIEGMKAPLLLNQWGAELEALGVERRQGCELIDFEVGQDLKVQLKWRESAENVSGFDSAILALGGGSWEPNETPVRWTSIFDRKGIARLAFVSSNCGFKVDWPELLIEEAEGQPIKNIELKSPVGERAGDLVITRYGLEGTPIYAVGMEGLVHVDLKPDLTEQEMVARLNRVRENLSPLRRVSRQLGLSRGALALLFHCAPREALRDLGAIVGVIKKFPIHLLSRQPIEEAISSSGGIAWSELDDTLQLKKFPGIYLAGEMIDWDAPTGGFLIQACVSTGAWAAQNAIKQYAIKD